MSLPRVALLVLGHGRTEMQQQTVLSFHKNARHYQLARMIVVDDSHGLLGFCGAVRYGWARLREAPEAFDYVFHLEEDWLFNRAFSISHMTRVLDTEPQVAQVALRRGKEPSEPDAVIDRFPHEFTNRTTGMIGNGLAVRSQEWLEHRLFFTTNPCVYRRALINNFEWPEAPRCEAAFGETLIAEGATFSFWGDRDDAPWITHLGTQRTGHSY